MCAEGGCLSRFFPRVGNAAVLQTVWAAEMVAGLGGGGGGGGNVADEAAGQNQLAV